MQIRRSCRSVRTFGKPHLSNHVLRHQRFALLAHAPAVVGSLVATIGKTLSESNNQTVSVTAMKALACIGEPAFCEASKIVILLTSGDDQIRHHAERALTSLESMGYNFFGDVVRMLQSSDAKVRIVAALCLDATFIRSKPRPAFGTSSAHILAAALARSLSDAEPCVRKACVHALSRLGKHGTRHIESIARLLNDADVGVQITVLNAFSEMHQSSHRYAYQVAGLLMSADIDVRASSVNSLASMAQHKTLGDHVADKVVELIADQSSRSTMPRCNGKMQIRAAAIAILGQMTYLGANMRGLY